jgi:hypothetical protein
MTHEFEYDSYDDADRIAILENKTAELQRLLAVMPPGGERWDNVGTPGPGHREAAGRHAAFADGGYPDDGYAGGYPEPDAPEGPLLDAQTRPAGGRARGHADGDAVPAAPGRPGNRTESLISHGRQRARRSRGQRLLAHWRLLAVGAVAALAGIIAGLVALGGSGASWPASVSSVRAQIKQACQNADTAAEPSGLNFACDTGTQSVLWVFSLLTSGNNPGFVDQSTGRKGLEPITPAQGGNIAWSLNLHHPYNPASPGDSLQVAARAINNIISGATLTSSSGAQQVEPGLESKGANCQRYTGSARLVTRAGYPARCAQPVTSGAGQAALVSDVFQQWMGGTPSTIANEAGVLFENADNPGDSRVQAILASLPSSGG